MKNDFIRRIMSSVYGGITANGSDITSYKLPGITSKPNNPSSTVTGIAKAKRAARKRRNQQRQK